MHGHTHTHTYQTESVTGTKKRCLEQGWTGSTGSGVVSLRSIQTREFVCVQTVEVLRCDEKRYLFVEQQQQLLQRERSKRKVFDQKKKERKKERNARFFLSSLWGSGVNIIFHLVGQRAVYFDCLQHWSAHITRVVQGDPKTCHTFLLYTHSFLFSPHTYTHTHTHEMTEQVRS